MSRSVNRRIQAVLLDIDNDDDVRDLLHLLGSSYEAANVNNRTAEELAMWILENEPVELPAHVAAPSLEAKCNAYLLLSECSIEPKVVITAALSEIEDLLGVRSPGEADLSGWLGSRTVGRRVDSIRERITRIRSGACTYGLLEVDEAARTVFADGQDLGLTPTEYRLLRKFVRGAECVQSREKLLNAISQDCYDVADRSIDAHIKNLRRKIRTSPAAGVKITTVYGIGYKLEKSQASGAKTRAVD